jgi:hypothetical protein
MPEYLPLAAFRQGLLPGDCGLCAWWQTTGAADTQGPGAAAARHEWQSQLDHEWGHVGLLVHEPAARRAGTASAGPVITASIHFAPASSLPRLRELPFPPLPPLSAFLFCLCADEDVPRWTTKRLIHKAIYEVRRRGVDEVYAVARTGRNGDNADCRFFRPDLLTETGFTEVAADGRLALMRLENRGLISIVHEVQSAVRRLFTKEEEPAPSPAAWAE